MKSTIYVVQGSQEDKRYPASWTVKAFGNRIEASAYAEYLNDVIRFIKDAENLGIPDIETIIRNTAVYDMDSRYSPDYFLPYYSFIETELEE